MAIEAITPLRDFVPSALTAADRDEIGEIIEYLVGVLDMADGDCDLEDDDPAGGNIEDDGEPEEGHTPDWPIDQRRCVSPELVAHDARAQLDMHRERFRESRCAPRYVRNWRNAIVPVSGEFRLMSDPRVPTARQMLRRKRGAPRQPRA